MSIFVQCMNMCLQNYHCRSVFILHCCFFFMHLQVFGSGAAAQVITSEGTHGSYLTIQLGSALGAIFGMLVAQGVSGAHLNPVYSMSLCVLGRHPWTKLPLYSLSQLIGAFLGAGTVYLQYYDAIQAFTGGQLLVAGPNATAGIFSSYPAEHLSFWGGLVDQVVAAALFLLCCMALEDKRNGPLPDGLQPIVVGVLILTMGVSMGSNCGFPLNPARDLGPRLFTFIAGWGPEVFKAGGGWWWVPLVAPFVGGLLGTLTYELLIEAHHPNTSNEEQSPRRQQEVVELEEMELEEVVVDSGHNT
uniref:Aquaporin 10b n=1 Tax=Sphaeramia orbicularis TaxID=375764 RepID=A0A673ANM6_9TELE